MKYFLETVETIERNVGFEQYDVIHLAWLLLFLVTTVVNCIIYHRLGSVGRSRWEKTVAVLLIADELFKEICLIIGGRYTVQYLPFHLCSINIFLIAANAWKKNTVINNFLYTVCIPGTMAALLFPSWTELPLGNFMHIHSFTVHILLALYPIVLAVNGVLKPRAKDIPRCLLLLLAMAGFAYIFNLLFDTNFMFLMSASKGNPLYLFKKMWGSHLLGFPVIIAGVLVVMYVPLVLYRKCRRKLTS
ncbi:MAG: YwaF family protein [Oscillospiraceae bacterium]|nr:YwaF family protein [Oscillospiraceae bacterium]